MEGREGHKYLCPGRPHRNQFRFIAMKKPLALFKRSASVKRLKRIPKVSDKFAQGNTSFADSN